MLQDLIQWCHRGYIYNPSFIGEQILSHDVYHLSNDESIVFFCEKETHKPMSEDQFCEFVDFMIRSSQIY